MVAIAKRVVPILNFKPCRDYVLFEPIEPGETAGGIVVSADADLGPPKGFVVAVGDGRPSEWNPKETIPVSCKPGDVVYVHGTVVEVLLDGKEYGMVRDTNIVGLAPQG
jgi:chaperonin GroES